jgi:low temperature requirement protein LtrA
MTQESPAHAGHVETRVTNLELFFDLVFVFAVTQVTTMLAADGSVLGAMRGLLVLAAIWWAWVAYAWLTNNASADRIGVRLSLLCAMGAMLVVALSVPEAFAAAAPVFAISLFVVRVAHLLLFALTARTAALRKAVKLLTPGVVTGGSLLIVAAFLRGKPQLALWFTALAFDYAAPLLGGTAGWQVSPAHFAERHGLIVIIALGEAIISLGVGAAGLPIDASLVVAAVTGLVCAACLWWVYFDMAITFAERKLRELHGAERNRLARDSYSYLHLPIIAGIVLFALGSKKTLAHLHEPLHGLAAIGLGIGPALVLVTLSVLRKRHVGRHNRMRLLVAALCGGVVPVALRFPALLALSAVGVLLVGLVVAEAFWSRRMRAQARS